ncbi:uncharacterized protein LOC117650953 [Thrips palmi]|uniref:Uncharacterized protein LOC117650953 n=1 Tax=Thrips palmi TaxID=161013 RepID=A0A6P8ZYL5_THRPL|nr:uncharacterized protein LOC117650953 [Thrips palmi]
MAAVCKGIESDPSRHSGPLREKRHQVPQDDGCESDASLSSFTGSERNLLDELWLAQHVPASLQPTGQNLVSYSSSPNKENIIAGEEQETGTSQMSEHVKKSKIPKPIVQRRNLGVPRRLVIQTNCLSKQTKNTPSAAKSLLDTLKQSSPECGKIEQHVVGNGEGSLKGNCVSEEPIISDDAPDTHPSSPGPNLRGKQHKPFAVGSMKVSPKGNCVSEINGETILPAASALQETHLPSSSKQDDQDLGAEQHGSHSVGNEEVSLQDGQEESNEDTHKGSSFSLNGSADHGLSSPLKSSPELSENEQPVSNTKASRKVVSPSEEQLTPYQRLRLNNLAENQNHWELVKQRNPGVLAPLSMNLPLISKTSKFKRTGFNNCSNDFNTSSGRKVPTRNSSEVAKQLLKETISSSSDDLGEDSSDGGIVPLTGTEEEDSDSSSPSSKKSVNGAKKSLFGKNKTSIKHTSAQIIASSQGSAVSEKFRKSTRPLHSNNNTASKNQQPRGAQKPPSSLKPQLQNTKSGTLLFADDDEFITPPNVNGTLLFAGDDEFITPPNVNATKRKAVSLGSKPLDKPDVSSSPNNLISQQNLGGQEPPSSSKPQLQNTKSGTPLSAIDAEHNTTPNVNAENKRRAKSLGSTNLDKIELTSSSNNLISQQNLGAQKTPSSSKPQLQKRKSGTLLFTDDDEFITPPNVNAPKRKAVSLGSISLDKPDVSSSPNNLISQQNLGAQKPPSSSKPQPQKRKSGTPLSAIDAEHNTTPNVNAENKRKAKSLGSTNLDKIGLSSSSNNLSRQQKIGPKTSLKSNSTSSNKAVSQTSSSSSEDSDHSLTDIDNVSVSGCDNDLSEPLSAGELHDHLQTTKQKPPRKVELKRERKKLRNCGKSYVRQNGKTVMERKPSEVHVCSKLKCQDIITEEIADTLCQEFWNLADIDRERQYIASRINRCRPVRRRQRFDDSERSRNFQYKYYLDINGERHQVCKSTFLGTLCLSERMVRTVTDQVASAVSSLPVNDRRGHCAPKHKLPAATEAAIKKHIDSFPSYVSHYAREQTNALYFASNLNYKKMYQLYCEADYPKVSYSVYYLRVKASGRKFKKASFATCSKCDRFKLQIDAATSEDERRSLRIQLERHHRKAEQAYALKRDMKEEAEADPTMRVLVYDMEKVLPCPYLKCKDAFYLRQLSVFNVTVTDTTTKRTHCYMWDEVEGGRSANSIASSVLKHIISEVPHGVKRIVIFSDACTSQNRNSHVAAMYHVALQEHPTLQTIEHIFLIPGHTHLEVDNKHSVMERFKSNRDKVSHPEEYYDLIHEAGLTDLENFPDGKFFVVRMHKKFYNFADLLSGPLIKREVTLNQNKFNWLDTNWFRYTKEKLGLVEVKASYNPLAHFDVLSFLRRGIKSSAVAHLAPLLKKFYTSPQPISELKKKDLISMLPFIDKKYHEFYHSLPTSPTAQDVDPDLED